MTHIARGVATLTAALLLTIGWSTTTAATADPEPPPLPPCDSITQMQCTGTFTNLLHGGDLFCQSINGLPLRCEAYWPFRNPTANTHAARTDADAFPFDYDTAKTLMWERGLKVESLRQRLTQRNDRVAHLEERLDRKQDRIVRRGEIIERLRDRVERLR